jgi:hypothetical protein
MGAVIVGERERLGHSPWPADRGLGRSAGRRGGGTGVAAFCGGQGDALIITVRVAVSFS